MIAVVLIPIGAALMVYGASLLFERLWNRNLGVEIVFGADHAVVGDETTIHQTVTNGKLLPILVLQVAYQTARGLHIASGSKVTVSDRVNIVEVFSLRPYERAERTLQVTCERRGYYEIRQASLTAWHFLDEHSLYMNVGQNTSLYVYPERVQLDSLFMIIDRLSGDVKARNVLYEDPFTFRGIREYTEQDPMTRINWKASARTGALQVNLRDYTAGQRVLLLLNLEDPITPYAEDLLEDSIRIAATIGERLIQHQIPVSLITNGRDVVTGMPVALEPGSSSAHLQVLLEDLARLNVHAAAAPFEEILQDRLMRAAAAEEACCVISSSRRDDIVEHVEQLGEAQGGILWVCPLLQQDEDKSVGPYISLVRMNHEELAR